MSNEKGSEESIWIRRTDEIPTANMASLRRSLLTGDGMDVKIKGPALDEIILRSYLQRKKDTIQTIENETGLSFKGEV